MKKLIRFSLFTFAIFALGVGLLAWWVSTHEDELKQGALKSLNEGLLTEMKIDTLSYSFFAHFPNASLRCQNVVLFDTFEDRDTLLWAKELSLEVSLFNLISGDYRFDQVRVSDGGMHMKRNATGGDNYHFWKQSESTDTTEVAFALETVKLENILYILDDEYSKVNVRTAHLNATVTGNFSGDEIKLEGELSTPDALVSVEGKRWVPNLPIAGTLSTVLDVANERYAFPTFNIAINEVNAEGSALFALLPEGVNCSIDANFSDIVLANVPDMLPAEEGALLKSYAMKGDGAAHFTLTGLSGNGNTPAWEAKGNLSNASVEQIAEGVSLDHISTSFEVAGGANATDKLVIRSFSGELEGGTVSFNGVWSDFTHPHLNFKANAEVDLHAAQAFLNLDPIGQFEGDASLTLSYIGKAPFLRKPDAQTFSNAMKNAEVSGTLLLFDAEIQLASLPRALEEVNAQIQLLGDHADIEQLSLKVGETDLLLKGKLTNFVPWAMNEGATLYVDADCQSNLFDLNSFVSNEAVSEATSAEAYDVDLPSNIVLKLSTNIAQFSFREFRASTMKGDLSMDHQGIYFRNMSCQTAGGTYSMSLSNTRADNGYSLSVESHMRKIDIAQLFEEFEDFGQDFITSANVHGLCTADATFRAYMSKSLEIDPASIVSHIDLKLENGELIELQSMAHISQYMKENKLISPFVRTAALEEKLKHIHFETLENQIEIRNERIYFPTMDIHSSAMDITVKGSHWFNQSIDYSVGLYLRDFLIQANQTEFGEVEDDGLGNRFFLSMTGTTDNPNFGYDRLARKEVRKQERQEEKESFKQLLREELNLFGGKDSTSTPEETPPKKTGVTVDWGEGGDDKPKKSSTTAKEEKQGKKLWKLLKANEEEKEKVKIELDDEDY